MSIAEHEAPVAGCAMSAGWRSALSSATSICNGAMAAHKAASESPPGKLMLDKNYWQRVNGAADCFIAGLSHDTIWQAL